MNYNSNNDLGVQIKKFLHTKFFILQVEKEVLLIPKGVKISESF